MKFCRMITILCLVLLNGRRKYFLSDQEKFVWIFTLLAAGFILKVGSSCQEILFFWPLAVMVLLCLNLQK